MCAISEMQSQKLVESAKLLQNYKDNKGRHKNSRHSRGEMWRIWAFCMGRVSFILISVDG